MQLDFPRETQPAGSLTPLLPTAFASSPPPPSPVTACRAWPCWGLTLQELGYIFQLGDVVFAEPAVLFQKWEDVVVLVAGVRFIQGLQGPEHCPPGRLLFLCVVHPRDGLPTRIQAWNRCLQRGSKVTRESRASQFVRRCHWPAWTTSIVYKRKTTIMLVPTGNHGLVEELLSLWETIWPFCFLTVCLFKVEIDYEEEFLPILT